MHLEAGNEKKSKMIKCHLNESQIREHQSPPLLSLVQLTGVGLWVNTGQITVTSSWELFSSISRSPNNVFSMLMSCVAREDFGDES